MKNKFFFAAIACQIGNPDQQVIGALSQSTGIRDQNMAPIGVIFAFLFLTVEENGQTAIVDPLAFVT